MNESERKQVLLSDCHEDVLITLEKMLEEAGFETVTAWTAADTLKLLDTQRFDVLLINDYLIGGESQELLRAIGKQGSQINCIVMVPNASEGSASMVVEKLGVCDVVYKHAYHSVVEKVRKSSSTTGRKLYGVAS